MYFEIDKYYPVWTGQDQARPVQDCQSADRTEPYPTPGPSGLVESFRIKVFATGRENMITVDFATPKNYRHQSIKRASTILGIACCKIQGLCYDLYT